MHTEKKRLKYDEDPHGNTNYLKVPHTPMKRSQSEEERTQQERYNAEITDRFTSKITLLETKNSTLYRVTDFNHQTSALKELNPLILSKSKILQKNSLLEFQHAKLLQDHPNIVRYDNFIQFGPYISFIMEYLSGGTLETYLFNESLIDPITGIEKEILWYFLVDLLNGLSYMHQQNIVHLDIKPANILLAPRRGKDNIPSLKIGDLGLSRIIGTNSKRENKKGDGKYLAPELLIPGAIITPCVDIFSLGICVYEMATDYKASNELWQNIIHDTPGLFDKISTDLKPLLSLMLSKDPQFRISASGCLKIDRLQNLWKECHYDTLAFPQSTPIPPELPETPETPKIPTGIPNISGNRNGNHFIMIEEMEEISSSSDKEQLGKVRKKLF